MTKQIIFAITLLITLGVFTYTTLRIISFFKLTSPAFPVRDFGKRFGVMMKVAFGQTKIFRLPVIGFFHALVFWGFCVIIFGSIEMVIDGLTGTDRVLKFLGPVYNIIMASGDIFALIVAIMIIIFLARRRIFFHIKRFEGIEMKKMTHIDANIALSIILLLMFSLLCNECWICGKQKACRQNQIVGLFPVSTFIAGFISGGNADELSVFFMKHHGGHIFFLFSCLPTCCLIQNIFMYSCRFPMCFFPVSIPLGKLTNMDSITREVKLMMDPNTAFAAAPATDDTPPERFGVKDAEDASWKNYFDSSSLYSVRKMYFSLSGKYHR